MKTKIELINNSYTRRFQIRINGEPVSAYSNLEKYMDEPFCYWCDKIFDEIYEECNNDNFYLHFQSRKEELVIMEKLAQDYPYCIQYSSSPLIRATSLLERIKDLNTLIRTAHLSAYPVFNKQVLFLLPESMKHFESDLRELEVKNSFCQIKSVVMYYQEYILKRLNADIIILFSDGKTIEESMQRLNVHRDFGIHIGNKKEFLRKKEEMLIYETKEDTIFETVFDCLLLSPLLDIFYDCINSLPVKVREKYKEELERLKSISLKIIPIPENTMIEVGKSSRIQFKTDMKGYEVKESQLYYSYSEKGIIQCNGFFVEGIRAGKATLYIYKEGEHIPCADVVYTVIKRNRITELMLEDEVIQIGEGDHIRLNYTFLPKDADNADLIEWSSDNNTVATVDSYGNLRAVGKGTCMIRCYAEQVSASCRCTVKPHLKSIIPESTEIVMVYGQEQIIKIKLVPENSIDNIIVLASMNMQIVNIVGRTVKAIGTGSTRIIIQNKEETVRTDIMIHVITEEKKDTKKEKKKSWLSKLFH